jgi:hypothetical protein
MSNKSNKLTIDLKDAIDFNINFGYSNGIPAVQFRKTISACDKNIVYIKDLIKKALNEDTEIIMPVRLQIVNKPLAKGRLKTIGINLD